MGTLDYFNYIVGSFSPDDAITINVHDGSKNNAFVCEINTTVSSLSKSNGLRQLFEKAAYVMNEYAYRDVDGRPAHTFDLSFDDDV